MKPFTKAEDAFLRENYRYMPAKAMSRVLGRSESGARQRMKILGIVVPAEIVQQFKKASQIQPGNIPFNKGRRAAEYLSPETLAAMSATMFKKGQLPHNTAAGNGEITTRRDKTGRLYKYIRIDLSHWDLLQRHVWQQHHGPIPKGHVIVFKNGDTLNCDIDNLEMISMKENLERNTIARFSPELRSAMHLLRKLNKTIQHGKEQNR
jgi:hypothetical protein